MLPQQELPETSSFTVTSSTLPTWSAVTVAFGTTLPLNLTVTEKTPVGQELGGIAPSIIAGVITAVQVALSNDT